MTRTMKKTPLLAAVFAAAIPLVTVLAEDTAKPEASPQTKEQNSCSMEMMGMKMGKMMMMMMGMGMGNMMSSVKDQDA